MHEKSALLITQSLALHLPPSSLSLCSPTCRCGPHGLGGCQGLADTACFTAKHAASCSLPSSVAAGSWADAHLTSDSCLIHSLSLEERIPSSLSLTPFLPPSNLFLSPFLLPLRLPFQLEFVLIL